MTDDMSYTTSTQYHLPAHPQYYPAPHANHGHPHDANPPQRTENMQRKRPKYTRSKTGCMTCRVKKIKCDETKPNCMRCTHGQRDCTWPEGVPARKKSLSRRDSEGRPSTEGSSGLSDGSTPPTREHTPPRRATVDMGLMPIQSRRRLSDPYLLHAMSTEPDPVRRVTTNTDRVASGYPPSTPNLLTMIPETYTTQSRYEHYPHHSSRTAGFRAVNPESVGQWNGSEYFSTQERSLVAHMPNDSHTRYQ